MLDKLKNLKENTIVRIVGNIAYWLLVLVTLAVLLVVLMQRFSNNTISLGGLRIFNVITESMMPKYEVGDVLLSKEADIENINVGDDVVYLGNKGEFKDRIVTHQVIDIEKENGEYVFHTKGIANEEEDPVVSGEQILGTVIYNIKSLGVIVKTINNLYSFYFIVFLPMVVLIFIEIRKVVINHIENKKQD